jgi:hypothetical protein
MLNLTVPSPRRLRPATLRTGSDHEPLAVERRRDTRQPSPLASNSVAPRPSARPSVAWMTSNATRVVTMTDGRLARMLSCCAARMSLDLAEIVMAIQIDHAAMTGVKIS